MNIFDCIMKRRSVRRFQKKEVDDKLIGVMLHMATQAPSAGNVQEWQFIVVKNEEIKKKLAEASLDQEFVAKAPVDIVVCADMEKIGLKYGERGTNLYFAQDTANATMIILLTATALGLGSCWVGAFDEDDVKKILELPEKLKPVAIIPVGYAAEVGESRRIPFENLTWTDRYGKKYDISYLFQPGPKEEVKFKPIGNYIQDVLEKYRKKIKR
ncbi:MAG: nitroreductase family protein [Candidatus Aenigmatarchaeota archaeon]